MKGRGVTRVGKVEQYPEATRFRGHKILKSKKNLLFNPKKFRGRFEIKLIKFCLGSAFSIFSRGAIDPRDAPDER